jgi:hypothetical protein
MGNLTCGLAYMTVLSVGEVETWLEAHCPGDWTVRLADDSDPLARGKKKVEVLFENRADMDTFKARFKSYEAERAAGGAKAGTAGAAATKAKGGLTGMLRPDRSKGGL